ncbi:MAG: 6,7-dimethyl-8-ribityllumazine synthase [Candidatus Micrarchaeota archaeon]
MVKIAIVYAKFNPEITSVMVREAIVEVKANGAKVGAVVGVPGCFEIPLACQRLLKRKDVDCVVALGAIITGGTGHDGLIADAIAGELLDMGLDFDKHVSLGILGPKITLKQAKSRAKGYAKRAAIAAIAMSK